MSGPFLKYGKHERDIAPVGGGIVEGGKDFIVVDELGGVG